MTGRRHGVHRRRRGLSLIAALLAVTAIFYIINCPAIVGVAATTRELPIYCVKRDTKVASLTFDAAWGNADTQQLIDILGKYNVKATFFVVGAWAAKYPESVKALHDAGHEVMNHSDDHAHFAKLSAQQIIKNVTACNQKVSAITGVSPSLFRCPYGEYDDHVVSALKSMGMYTIQWDVDSLDWKNLTAPEITQRVTNRVQPGSIVLFHNAALHTPEALPEIIETLTGKGYTLVPVTQLLIKGDFTIDHTGRQLPAS